jgi:glyoxylase-like metal-dependent hydrolase (beta-lactamase superfamily II)
MILASTLLGNSQRLDGGAMFGNAPRALWSRWLAPDELNRITFACRTLLVEEQGCRTLFETGIGCFFEPELRERYGVVEPNHVLLDSLARLGLGHGDVDRIVLSHLHFDHAGGLLAPYRTGRPIELAFQRAEIVVGKQALERATRPHPRDRASFVPGLPELLRASGRLRVVDGPAEARQLLGERFNFVETNGHTPGMLHASVRGQSANLLFCADLVPGRAWVHLPITMGYDRYAEHLVDEKSEVLARAVTADTMLVYTHDLEVAASRVMVGNGNRYQPTEAVGDFSRWDLDADRVPTSMDAAS